MDNNRVKSRRYTGKSCPRCEPTICARLLADDQAPATQRLADWRAGGIGEALVHRGRRRSCEASARDVVLRGRRGGAIRG